MHAKFWQDRTVHEGLDSNGVESQQETDFFEAHAVHKGLFVSICVLERSTFLSRWQLSQACAPITAKLCVSLSAVISAELRQSRAKSLAVVCDGSSLGEEISRRVNSARLIQPRKRQCPNLVVLLNWLATPSPPPEVLDRDPDNEEHAAQEGQMPSSPAETDDAMAEEATQDVVLVHSSPSESPTIRALHAADHLLQ